MIGLLINLIIPVLVLGVAWWIITLLPLPAPFPLIVRVVFVLIALIVVIDVLLGLSGGSGGRLLLWR
jgi:hypothetical protein